MPEIPTPKLKKVFIILAIYLCIAIGINLIILEIFGQKSPYRAEHSLVGIIMLIGFVYTFQDNKTSRLKIVSIFLLSLIPCYFGTVFPDLDIKLLGIGGHRNPLFHSGILFFVLVYLMRRYNSIPLAVLIAAFGVGLGSHLIWDLFDHADVRWIPGATLDRLWVGVNGALCFVLAKTFLSARLKKP